MVVVVVVGLLTTEHSHRQGQSLKSNPSLSPAETPRPGGHHPPKSHDSIFLFPDSPPTWSTCFCRVLLATLWRTSVLQILVRDRSLQPLPKDPLSLHPIYASHGAFRELTSLCGSSTQPVPCRPDQDQLASSCRCTRAHYHGLTQRRFGAFPVGNLRGTLIHACDSHFIVTFDAFSLQLKPPRRAVILDIAHKLGLFVPGKFRYHISIPAPLPILYSLLLQFPCLPVNPPCGPSRCL